MSLEGVKIGWHAASYSPAHASVRLRLLGPMAALRARGIAVEPFAPGRRYDAVILSKSFTRQAERIAEAARRDGRPLILDVCDNLLAKAEQEGKARQAARIRVQLARASLVTTPTPAMAALLAPQLPPATPVRVIPDLLEDMTSLAARLPSLADRWRLARLTRFLARHPAALHCVWFGNSAGRLSGLVHVEAAVRELERFAERRPVTLTIISDTWLAYRKASRVWGVPSYYLPWSLGGFAAALKRHRVALVPVTRNDFTTGKSINRPATAILAGLGVIADPLPAYEELRPYIAMEDWQGGLARYAEHWPAEQPRLAAAIAHLRAAYGADAIADHWQAAIAEALAAAGSIDLPPPAA